MIAEILRPRGNRGEVLARSQTDVPGRIASLKSAQAHLCDGSDILVEIAEAWMHKGDWVLKFSGVDSIDAAKRFCRANLWVTSEERGALPEGQYFRSDLTGCAVIDRGSGDPLGVVSGWQQYGEESLLMEVDADGRELLIPFVASRCDVDLALRTIRLDVPAGLREL